MWDELRETLSTTLNCGKLGWGRQGSHPQGYDDVSANIRSSADLHPSCPASVSPLQERDLVRRDRKGFRLPP